MKYRFNTTYNLIVSLISLLLGILLIFMGQTIATIIFKIIGIFIVFLSVVKIVDYFTTNNTNKMPLIEAIVSSILGFIILFYPTTVIGIILGIILVLFPLYNIIISKNKIETLKKEIVRISFGAILIILGPSSTINVLFYIAGGIIILSSLASIIIYLIMIIKTRKGQRKERKDNEVIDV